MGSVPQVLLVAGRASSSADFWLPPRRGAAKCCSHRHVTAACTGWRAKMAKGALGSLALLPTMGVLRRLQIQDPTSGSTAPEGKKKPVKLCHAPAASLILRPPHPLRGGATLGELRGEGVQCQGRLQEAEESAQCPNRSIQSLLKIAKCVPGGEGGGAGCLGSGPRWQPGPVPPIELWIPHPSPAGWHGAPGPHGDTRPRSQRMGTILGQQGRPGGVSLQDGCPPGLAQLRESPGSVPEC